ncbi:hypothetical protein DL765_005154 [Monosporascus sp. GIB2]|nr:hypothetical protein DL765_005154 [Monosporascus sp. GIB2]
MLSKTIFTVAFLATWVLAWPVTKRDEYDDGDNNNNGNANSFTPKATYNYDVSTGAIECSPTTNKVTKSDTDNGHHITTLLTFEYPTASAGKMCQFGFRLEATDTLTGNQGGLVDLFSSLAPAPGCTSGWGPGNQRNVHMARLKPVLDGEATYTDTYTTYLTAPSPCKSPGTVEAFELVGVNDNVHVEWEPSVSGAFISYS